MNYMEYVDDVAMFMFSNGQVQRMQACMDTNRRTINIPWLAVLGPARGSQRAERSGESLVGGVVGCWSGV